MLSLTVERVNRNWSKSELARRARIALTDLSRIEAKKIPAYPGWRKRLSDALEIPESALFDKNGNPKEVIGNGNSQTA